MICKSNANYMPNYYAPENLYLVYFAQNVLFVLFQSLYSFVRKLSTAYCGTEHGCLSNNGALTPFFSFVNNGVNLKSCLMSMHIMCANPTIQQ